MRALSLASLALAACVSAQGRPVEGQAQSPKGEAQAESKEQPKVAKPRVAKPKAPGEVVDVRGMELVPDAQGNFRFVVPEGQGKATKAVAVPMPNGPTGPRGAPRNPGQRPGADRADLERRLQELSGRLDRLQRMLEARLRDHGNMPQDNRGGQPGFRDTDGDGLPDTRAPGRPARPQGAPPPSGGGMVRSYQQMPGIQREIRVEVQNDQPQAPPMRIRTRGPQPMPQGRAPRGMAPGQGSQLPMLRRWMMQRRAMGMQGWQGPDRAPEWRRAMQPQGRPGASHPRAEGRGKAKGKGKGRSKGKRADDRRRDV